MSKQTKLIVDHVENEYVVSEIDGIPYDVPDALFPDDMKEGQHFKVTVERDEESELAARASIESLQDELRNPSGKGTKHI